MADPITVERDGQVFQFAANTPPDVQERRIANYFGKSRTEPAKTTTAPSAAPAGEAEIPIGDVPGKFVRNLAPSAVEKVGDIAQAITSPVETAKGLGKLALSGPAAMAGKIRDLLGVPISPEDREWLDRTTAPGRALVDDYAGKFGSWKGFKKYASEDPTGLLLDVTLPFGAGTKAISAAPGFARSAAVTGKALENATSATLGWSTGAGKQAIDEMVAAGKAGNRSPLDHMRGNAQYTDVVDEMKDALAKLRQDRSSAYVTNMQSVKGQTATVPFTNIDAALAKADDIGSFKGVNLETNPGVVAARDRIKQVIEDWKTLNPQSEMFKGVNPADLTPANFHTPIGMDALKQVIGNIRDAVPLNDAGFRPIHKYAGDVYRAIRGEITAADPTYAKAMGDYEKASEFLTEATKSLSLGQKTAADTSLRKLQSVFRNNVNTNFGNRADTLRDLLAQSGKSDVMGDIAGQQLSAWRPRGIGRLMAGPVPVAVAAAILSPKALAAVPLMSPRLMGEASHAYGRNIRGIGRIAGPTADATTQAANIARLLEDSGAYEGTP